MLLNQELHYKVCQLANALKELGVEKGDRVCLYMPMVIESVVTILACARIGAVHSIVFAGFSSNALAPSLSFSRWIFLQKIEFFG